MSLTYTTWLNSIAVLLATSPTNPNLLIEVPNAIDYAELRIFRDLNLLSTIATDTTQTTTPNNRNVTIPSSFVVVNDVNIISPAGQTDPELGTRNQLTKIDKGALDFLWNSVAGAGLPTLYALLNQGQIVLGPWPASAYTVEFIGTQRPTPLSNTNQTTFLSTSLPDIFEAATMIHLNAYKMNFGAQADDPRSAMSWETQYEKLITGANAEEIRKRYAGSIRMPPSGTGPSMPAAAA